jgi:O-antigen ligase
MRGRLGKVSLDFASKHFQSVSGSSEDQALSGSAGGIALRLGWWKKIGRELSQTPENLMFGLGYGMPLVNYTLGGGVVVREPHNSFISVLARLGVLGAFCWISMQFTLFWTWWSGFRLARRHGWTVDAMRLLVMMIFCSIILVGIVGEDMLEKPFNAAPYYFFWGVIIAYVSHVRAVAARGPARDKGQAPPAAQFEQIGAGRGILT